MQNTTLDRLEKRWQSWEIDIEGFLFYTDEQSRDDAITNAVQQAKIALCDNNISSFHIRAIGIHNNPDYV